MRKIFESVILALEIYPCFGEETIRKWMPRIPA
jgi:hypothetical protein